MDMVQVCFWGKSEGFADLRPPKFPRASVPPSNPPKPQGGDHTPHHNDRLDHNYSTDTTRVSSEIISFRVIFVTLYKGYAVDVLIAIFDFPMKHSNEEYTYRNRGIRKPIKSFNARLMKFK